MLSWIPEWSTSGDKLTTLRAALDGYDSASAELLASRQLQRRTDTKYALPERGLETLLRQLSPRYSVIRNDELAGATYHTRYFDTCELDLFHAHRRGLRPRVKVRRRDYLQRKQSYLETKVKNQQNQTIKVRRKCRDEEQTPGREEYSRVVSVCPDLKGELQPSLDVYYQRLTLVGTDRVERITFDLDVKFRLGDLAGALGPVALVEIKQPRLDRQSPAVRALSELGIRPLRISKYCAGTMLLRPNERSHRLRPALRELRRYTHE